MGRTRKNLAWRRANAGARTLVATMRAHGACTALVSGGFTFFTERVAALCEFDYHFANILLAHNDALTGGIEEPILDRNAKLATMRRLAHEQGLRPTDTLAVGDGANDLAMLREAGLGVAFHAKPVVTAEIANRVDYADLRALLLRRDIPPPHFAATRRLRKKIDGR